LSIAFLRCARKYNLLIFRFYVPKFCDAGGTKYQYIFPKKLKKTVKHRHNSMHTEYPSLLTCIYVEVVRKKQQDMHECKLNTVWVGCPAHGDNR
jgi:hypothetical protein